MSPRAPRDEAASLAVGWRRPGLVPALWGAVALGTLGTLLWLAGGYYLTGSWDRPDHALHALWRSSGLVGHALGVVGTALILLNLSFILRRHWSALRGLGRLRAWLNMHVLTGLFGPGLVLFHTTFAPRTSVATAALASLGVLVLTGVIGRFVYVLVPHSVTGRELGRQALEARVEALTQSLGGVLEADAGALEALCAPPAVLPRTKLGCLLALPVLLWDLGRTRRRARALGRRLLGQENKAPGGGADAHAALQELVELVVARRRSHTLSVTRRLLRAWRSLHRIFAVLLVVMAIVHVAVALYFGYDGGFL